MQAILKGQRKQGKVLRQYIETSDDLTASFDSFSHHSSTDDLGKYMDKYLRLFFQVVPDSSFILSALDNLSR